MAEVVGVVAREVVKKWPMTKLSVQIILNVIVVTDILIENCVTRIDLKTCRILMKIDI